MASVTSRSPAPGHKWSSSPPGMPAAVWSPSQPADQIPINIYRNHINDKFDLRLKDSHELQHWSVSDPQAFWVDLWDYVGLIPRLPPGVTRAYDPEIPISQVPPFFESVTVNYAENVLTQPDVKDHATALVGLREGRSPDGELWTWSVLRENVRRVRSALLRSGIKQGDRVAALVSTSVWSVALFLGSASIGAIFTSIAPDLGLEVGVMSADVRNPLITVGMHLKIATSPAGDSVCRQPLYLQRPTTIQCNQNLADRASTKVKA